jgi:hypothetical protein
LLGKPEGQNAAHGDIPPRRPATSFGRASSGGLKCGARIESYIAPGNATDVRRADRAGRVCHWILEVHLVDRARQIGGFYEQLLDLG